MAGVSSAGPLRAVLLGSQTGAVLTGLATGLGQPVRCDSYADVSIYLVATAALSAGTLVIEERDQPQDVPGIIVTVTLATPFASTGGTYVYHLAPSSYGYLSARIGTTVEGGLVAAVLRAI